MQGKGISNGVATLILVAFCTIVFAVALHFNNKFPVLVFAGENSVATWLSTALLIFSAALCYFMSIISHWRPWLLLAGFFLLLAVDERFMLHERVKEWIIFSNGTNSRLLQEMPVFFGTGIGLGAAFFLWREMRWLNRALIIAGVFCGSMSVLIDVLAAGVIWEEGFKIIGEVFVAAALINNIKPGA